MLYNYRQNAKGPIHNKTSFAYSLVEKTDGMQKTFIIGEGVFCIEMNFTKFFDLEATLFHHYNGVEFEIDKVSNISPEKNWLEIVNVFFPEIKELIE
jgi:hypothetical protein